jgi:hypothetical protein
MIVGMTQARGLDPDEQLARLGWIDNDRLDGPRLPDLPQHCRFGIHSLPSWHLVSSAVLERTLPADLAY